MSLLLLSEIFPPRTGGSGRWFWEIYRRLPREQVVVAAGEHPEQDDFDRSHDLPIHRLPLFMRQWGLRSVAGLRGYGSNFWRLRTLLKTKEVREIHCGRCLPEGFLAWLLQKVSGTPYLCYVHGEDVATAATSRELAWMTRQVLAGARLVIANSRSSEQMLLGEWGLPAERIRVLHPGVDTTRFVPAPRNPDQRHRLGWNERRVVLTVGRLQQRKGHDMLIRSLARVQQRVPDVLYAIVGDGEERPRLNDLTRELGLDDHVQFLDEADDATLVNCYQQCDLFVLPNRAVGRDVEGFGMVLLEAQACGKPVVAGASGGTAETMQVQKTGLVIPCERPEELAAVLGDLLLDPDRRDRMGEAGRRWVVMNFDWEMLTDRACQLLGISAMRRGVPA